HTEKISDKMHTAPVSIMSKPEEGNSQLDVKPYLGGAALREHTRTSSGSSAYTSNTDLHQSGETCSYTSRRTCIECAEQLRDSAGCSQCEQDKTGPQTCKHGLADAASHGTSQDALTTGTHASVPREGGGGASCRRPLSLNVCVIATKSSDAPGMSAFSACAARTERPLAPPASCDPDEAPLRPLSSLPPLPPPPPKEPPATGEPLSAEPPPTRPAPAAEVSALPPSDSLSSSFPTPSMSSPLTSGAPPTRRRALKHAAAPLHPADQQQRPANHADDHVDLVVGAAPIARLPVEYFVDHIGRGARRPTGAGLRHLGVLLVGHHDCEVELRSRASARVSHRSLRHDLTPPLHGSNAHPGQEYIFPQPLTGGAPRHLSQKTPIRSLRPRPSPPVPAGAPAGEPDGGAPDGVPDDGAPDGAPAAAAAVAAVAPSVLGAFHGGAREMPRPLSCRMLFSTATAMVTAAATVAATAAPAMRRLFRGGGDTIVLSGVCSVEPGRAARSGAETTPAQVTATALVATVRQRRRALKAALRKPLQPPPEAGSHGDGGHVAGGFRRCRSRNCHMHMPAAGKHGNKGGATEKGDGTNLLRCGPRRLQTHPCIPTRYSRMIARRPEPWCRRWGDNQLHIVRDKNPVRCQLTDMLANQVVFGSLLHNNVTKPVSSRATKHTADANTKKEFGFTNRDTTACHICGGVQPHASKTWCMAPSETQVRWTSSPFTHVSECQYASLLEEGVDVVLSVDPEARRDGGARALEARPSHDTQPVTGSAADANANALGGAAKTTTAVHRYRAQPLDFSYASPVQVEAWDAFVRLIGSRRVVLAPQD
ncbi:LOW QUALITY PROTEIN: hypothetical protein BU14_0316s0016, partial [Porphyra umbilicalis]